MTTKKQYLLLVITIFISNLDLVAQTRNWKAFQIGWGVHRSQILNDGFHKLVEDGKISTAYGINISTSYIINPLFIRANFFTEQFQTDDVSSHSNLNAVLNSVKCLISPKSILNFEPT